MDPSANPSLSTRLQELLDKSEIRELTARYNHTFDDGDAEAYANTYTVDGGHTPEFGAGPSSNGQQRGREEHIAQCRRADSRVVHTTTDPLIEVDGDTARQVCTFIIFLRNKEKTVNHFALTGRYVDKLTRTSDGWRFAERLTLWDRHFDILEEADRFNNDGT